MCYDCSGRSFSGAWWPFTLVGNPDPWEKGHKALRWKYRSESLQKLEMTTDRFDGKARANKVPPDAEGLRMGPDTVRGPKNCWVSGIWGRLALWMPKFANKPGLCHTFSAQSNVSHEVSSHQLCHSLNSSETRNHNIEWISFPELFFWWILRRKEENTTSYILVTWCFTCHPGLLIFSHGGRPESFRSISGQWREGCGAGSTRSAGNGNRGH